MQQQVTAHSMLAGAPFQHVACWHACDRRQTDLHETKCGRQACAHPGLPRCHYRDSVHLRWRPARRPAAAPPLSLVRYLSWRRLYAWPAPRGQSQATVGRSFRMR